MNARATLDDVNSMGLIKQVFYFTKAMTAEATQLLAQVEAEKAVSRS